MIGLGSVFRSHSSREQSFFLVIMVFILLFLMSRIPFFAIVFVAEDDQFRYAVLTEQFPIIFKQLTVIYICKYKLNIYYVASFQRAKPWIMWAMYALTLIAILVPISISVT